MDPVEMFPVTAGDSMVQQTPRKYGMSFSNEVSMINCYKHCKYFFKCCRSVNFNVLIAYWMMAGYLGPVDSVEKAYQKGHKILVDLVSQEKRMLKPSDEDGSMIEPIPTDSEPVDICRHEGPCFTADLGFVDVLDNLGEVGSIACTDGVLKSQTGEQGSMLLIDGNHLSSRQVFHPPGKLRYLAYFNPSPKSLNLLLDKVKRPLSVLLLRDCDLLPEIDIPLSKFDKLTVLEISGLSHVPSFKPPESDPQKEDPLIRNISELSQLQRLHLSNFLTEKLPDNFFAKLTKLRWVILRGCPNLASLPSVRALKHLKMLDVSHCSALQKIVSSVLQTPDLEMLDFSYTSITNIPTIKESPKLTHLIARDVKLSELGCLKQMSSLKVLDLSGAKSVKDIEVLASNNNLTVLDLSRAGIKSIEFLPELVHLRVLILQECASLTELPPVEKLTKLEVFDISGCLSLKELPEGLNELKSLKKLNLSLTGVTQLPSFDNLTSLVKLSLRGLKVVSLEGLVFLSNIEELDLNSLQTEPPQDLEFDFLQNLVNLQILDLSHTPVTQLPSLSDLKNLKKLILENCQHLEAVPDLQPEVLDLSLPDRTTNDFPYQSEIEGQRAVQQILPSKNRFELQNLLPLKSVGESGYLDVRGKEIASYNEDQVESIQSQTKIGPGGAHSEVFYVGNRSPYSGFDRFKDMFKDLGVVIAHILETFSKSTCLVHVANIQSKALEKRFRSMARDLEFIRKHIGSLRRSENCKISEELLHGLIDTATDISDNDYRFDYTNVMQMLRVVVKLKLLIHRNRADGLRKGEDEKEKEKERKGEGEEEEEVLTHHEPNGKNGLEADTYDLWEKEEEEAEEGEDVGVLVVEEETEKKRLFTRSNEMKKVIDPDAIKDVFQTLRISYSDLTHLQQKCLLFFSAFPCTEFRDKNTGVIKLKNLVIRKSVLIQWWYGEDYLHPESYADLSSEIEETDSDADQISMTQTVGVDKAKTLEAHGNEILQALEDKGFIEPVMIKRTKSGWCCMRAYVHSFVTARAKEERLFDFSRKHGKLTPHFTHSNRACLLISQHNSSSPSSYEIWANYTNFPEKLESFKRVRTLFNVNESLIDIDVQWFSRMKHLSVLHLGSWCSGIRDPIEVVNQKFLKELKKMKQLRLLNLQGLLSIKKLPDSVAMLTNLRLLNLRRCSGLTELPDDVGLLKNLTHLDITHCHRLTNLPKGIRLLSKLEVLKGFRITDQGGPRQKKKICKLEDLLNLGRLRTLSLLVDKEESLRRREIRILRRIENLDCLKITWENRFMIDQTGQEQPDERDYELRSTCLRLMFYCLELHKFRHYRGRSRNLRKMVLHGLPHQTASYLLDPLELDKLEELHIVAGNIRTLNGGANESDKWNVKTLRMKFLNSLSMSWIEFRRMFPHVTYLEMLKCKKLALFPCDGEGVWRIPS